MKTTIHFLFVCLISLSTSAQYTLNSAHHLTKNDTILFNPPSGTVAPSGLSYGCLSYLKRPIWFYITTCGEFSGSNHFIWMNLFWNGTFFDDTVGLVMWGPFDDTLSIASKLTAPNIYDCEMIDPTLGEIWLDSLKFPKIYYGMLTVSDQVQDFSMHDGGPSDVWYDGRCGLCNSRVSNYYQDICMVTLDSATKKNRIIWEKQNNFEIESFNVYRESSFAGKYDSIGNVSVTSDGSFIDQVAIPNQKSFKYCLSGRDSCGFATIDYHSQHTNIDSAHAHQTIHLLASPGLSSEVNLSWNAYVGFTYSTFYIYRGSHPDSLVLLDSVSSSTYSYTDFSGKPGLSYYRVTVRNPNGCSPDGGATVYYLARSNNPNVITVGITELNSSVIKIIPNPTTGSFNLLLDRNIVNGKINIINALGQKIYAEEFTGREQRINCNLNQGIYFLRVTDGITTWTQKLIKE